jgi:hypothetical protein
MAYKNFIKKYEETFIAIKERLMEKYKDWEAVYIDGYNDPIDFENPVDVAVLMFYEMNGKNKDLEHQNWVLNCDKYGWYAK